MVLQEQGQQVGRPQHQHTPNQGGLCWCLVVGSKRADLNTQQAGRAQALVPPRQQQQQWCGRRQQQQQQLSQVGHPWALQA